MNRKVFLIFIVFYCFSLLGASDVSNIKAKNILKDYVFKNYLSISDFNKKYDNLLFANKIHKLENNKMREDKLCESLDVLYLNREDKKALRQLKKIIKYKTKYRTSNESYENYKNYNLLMIAASRGHIKLIKKVFKIKKYLDKKDTKIKEMNILKQRNQKGKVVLHYAVDYILFFKGIKEKLKEKEIKFDGESLSFEMIRKRSFEMIDFLVEKDPSILKEFYEKDKKRTILNYVLQIKFRKYKALLKKIIVLTYEKDIRDSEGRTALMLAFKLSGLLEKEELRKIIDELLSSKFEEKNIDARDESGRTALMYALKHYKDKYLIEKLIEKKANIMIKDHKKEYSVLRYALAYADEDYIVDVFLNKFSLDYIINDRDKENKNVLFVLYKKPKVFKYLMKKIEEEKGKTFKEKFVNYVPVTDDGVSLGTVLYESIEKFGFIEPFLENGLDLYKTGLEADFNYLHVAANYVNLNAAKVILRYIIKEKENKEYKVPEECKNLSKETKNFLLGYLTKKSNFGTPVDMINEISKRFDQARSYENKYSATDVDKNTASAQNSFKNFLKDVIKECK